MKNFVKYNFLNQRLDFQDSKPNPWKSFSEHVPPIALVVAMAVLYWILPPPLPEKNPFLGSNGQFWPNCDPKLHKRISQDLF